MAGEVEAFLLVLVAVVFLIILANAIRILREYERVVVFRLGRLQGIKGPGLILIIPIIDKTQRLDLRTNVIDVPKQRIVTQDNITVDVDAVVYYRVVDPVKAIVQVQNFFVATGLLSQTTLRDICGQMELDDLLTKRDEINKKLQVILDHHTDPWGVKVSGVTVKDVMLPETMLRAMAKQAEAERERRSRVIMAEGEMQASQKMAQAAEEYLRQPMALKLRELQTLAEIAREKNLIVVTSGGGLGDTAGYSIAMAQAEKRRQA
ncbi:MAG TPA: slipin family protein [Candidatus Thermoplasmatota archaeon]|nr:slipin family protein [Candidatus Thermoplasmatota archaeon]